ncbi:MAG: NADH-quinone oxidoreductase subunit M [Dissulfurispiraceae bacterium]
MTLVWLIAIPAAAGLIAWPLDRWNAKLPPWISLCAVAADLAVVLTQWVVHFSEISVTAHGPWLSEVHQEWIPGLGISFHLGMDGLSLILVTLTALLGMVAVISSWTEIRERVGFFHLNLLWILAGITGVFLALDLFLFYFFWELMLVPMYFLISLWGHQNRLYASTKFFIFTQLSGLLMFLAILGLYVIHGLNTGTYTFDYTQLLGTAMSESMSMMLMLGFLIAFAVKLPVVPVHNWLPDAHTEAPSPGSVILAGLLLKTGAYGLIRFVIPLFPSASSRAAPLVMSLAVVGILYGAIMAFAQTDFKRLVAYTSVSHMGFVLLGVFAWNELALQGAVLQIVSHGISTGALFFLAGSLQERIQTRDINRMGGLWSAAPRLGATGLFFALASLGLPGLGNFIAEFLILLGSYRVNATITVLAALGLVTATVYSLWMIQSIFHGMNKEAWKIPDLSMREMAVLSLLIICLVWLGLYPQPLLTTARQSLEQLRHAAALSQTASPPQSEQAGLSVTAHNWYEEGSGGIRGTR